MKNLILIILAAIVCTHLSGCWILENHNEIKKNSNIKYSQDYNPDPNGYLRHDGKYYIEYMDTIQEEIDVIPFTYLVRTSLYFFKNGSFCIYDGRDKDLFRMSKDRLPNVAYGIYKVIDSTLVQINKYKYNDVLHMHDMHTDYYRIINDSTVKLLKRTFLDGKEVLFQQGEIYRFVKTDTMPKFDIPIEKYGWMWEKSKKAKK